MSDLDDVSTRLREAHTRFTTAVAAIRPELHRYCSRMTGSVLDGEDLVQETLAQAAHRLAQVREDVPLRPLLFTIAHRRCVDFLRARSAAAGVELDEPDAPTAEIDVALADRQLAGVAFSRLMHALAPRERAVVILVEMLGHSLAEAAAVLDVTVGGVKAALHRGRDKLAKLAAEPLRATEAPSAAVAQYLEAFNRRDWVQLQTMLVDEIECELPDWGVLRGREPLAGNYLTTYAGLGFPWRLVWGEIEGESSILCVVERDGRWVARHAVRLQWRDGRVTRIRDYAHISYLFDAANVSFSPQQKG